ncbi:MAG: DUF896 domain-containing protein [Coprococcus sp.]
MITEADIARINELYHKMKTVGLTPEEKEEQARLRGAYVAAVRANMRSQLDNIDIKNPDGSVEALKDRAKKAGVKNKKYVH